jgi:hypothetical protein
MYKLLVMLVAISLLGFTDASAVLKAGSACSRVGATATLSGKKYTCISSGRKIFWNNGVIVKKVGGLMPGICPPKSVVDKNLGISEIRASTLIGMSEGEAENCANTLAWGYRVGQREDVIFAGTFDFRVDRVTVKVITGQVKEVIVG